MLAPSFASLASAAKNKSAILAARLLSSQHEQSLGFFPWSSSSHLPLSIDSDMSAILSFEGKLWRGVWAMQPTSDW
jgi:hypothetical protein